MADKPKPRAVLIGKSTEIEPGGPTLGGVPIKSVDSLAGPKHDLTTNAGIVEAFGGAEKLPGGIRYGDCDGYLAFDHDDWEHYQAEANIVLPVLCMAAVKGAKLTVHATEIRPSVPGWMLSYYPAAEYFETYEEAVIAGWLARGE